jgi:hypothetical protein
MELMCNFGYIFIEIEALLTIAIRIEKHNVKCFAKINRIESILINFYSNFTLKLFYEDFTKDPSKNFFGRDSNVCNFSRMHLR